MDKRGTRHSKRNDGKQLLVVELKVMHSIQLVLKSLNAVIRFEEEKCFSGLLALYVQHVFEEIPDRFYKNALCSFQAQHIYRV